MRRALALLPFLALVLVIIAGLQSLPTTAPRGGEVPEAEPEAEVPSVRLRRGEAPVRGQWRAVAPPAPQGLPAIGPPSGHPAPVPGEDAGPADVFDLPAAERDRVVEAAEAAIAELGTLCEAEVPEAGIDVLAALTVDEGGLLEAELSTYAADGEAMWATAEPIPDRLVACLDDVLWERGWPAVDGGARFALTLPLDPDETE